MDGEENRAEESDHYGLGPLFIYLGLSVLFFGRSLIGHFSDRYIGVGPDPSQFMWYMRWWPYALAHHLNPFLPHIIWPPTGVNIAWTVSIPLPSLIAYPFTATIGLIPAYNLLCLLCPTLAGWATFLVCRCVTRSYWPSVFGGFIFAFSAHMVGKTFGNLNDALVFPIPLAVYLSLLRLNERIGVRRFVILLALLLVAQFLFFIELFATMTLVGGITLLLAIPFAQGETRKRLTAMIPPIIVSYVVATIILSPYLYFLFAHRLRQAEIMSVSAFSIDLLNFFIPTPLNELGKVASLRHITSWFQCGLMESGGYLALPLIAIAVLFARHHRHETHGRLMIDLLLLLLVFSMGPFLQVMGHATRVGLPWLLFAKLPFIQKALPARFMLYALLDLAVIASLWLTELKARPVAKVAVAAGTVLFMLPNLTSLYWTTDANIPEFFSAGLYERYVSPGENVIIMPYGINGDTMLWQAESNMFFNMVQGWTGFPLTPKQFENWPMVTSMVTIAGLPDTERQLKAFIANYNIGAIIVAEHCSCVWEFHRDNLGPSRWSRAAVSSHNSQLWRRWFSTLGVTPVSAGGVLLYRVPLEQLAHYKRVDAVQMQTADAEQRFNTLLMAASQYIQGGRDPAKLTPMRAKELELIPSDWISEQSPARNPETEPVLNYMLLARWDNGDIALGVVASFDALEPVIKKYGPHANLIRYFTVDLPPRFLDKPTKEGPLLLMMTFDRVTLEKIAAQIEASHDGAAKSH